jgi:hypothetical protein
MLGDKAYDSAELHEELAERETSQSFQPLQQEAAIQLQQPSLQASLVDLMSRDPNRRRVMNCTKIASEPNLNAD